MIRRLAPWLLLAAAVFVHGCTNASGTRAAAPPLELRSAPAASGARAPAGEAIAAGEAPDDGLTEDAPAERGLAERGLAERGLAERGLAERGLAVYREQYCGTCHALDRASTSGLFGPTHNDFAAIAAARIRAEGYAGRAQTASDYTKESILEPGLYLTPGYEQTRFHMPAYTQLTAEDLDALVYFLLSEE